MTRAEPVTLAERSRRILDGARCLTLATVSRSGQPWACTLHYAWLAEPARLVYSSMVGAWHSRNIVGSPEVSGTLMVSGVDTGVAVASDDGAQFLGRCAEVSPEDVAYHHEVFFRAVLPDELREEWMLPLSRFRPPGEHRLYVVEITRWWVLDLATWGTDRVDRRIEVPVSALSGPQP